jgi:crossover junction endodeoxyribonuclease RusA
VRQRKLQVLAMSGGYIELPWMPSALRPNASSPGNWRRKSDAAKRYKGVCLILCRTADLSVPNANHLDIVFCPPDRRRRDLDNMLSSFKQGIDAIAETIGVDDSNFALTLRKGDPSPGGKVVVEVRA